jgi:hypothetical protein
VQGADAQKAAIKTACVRRDWLAWFYEKDKATYTSEVVRLQEALGLEEILAHTALKRCLHDFTKKEFSSVGNLVCCFLCFCFDLVRTGKL